MKKFFKWTGIVIAIPFALFIILSILIYIPPVQNFIVGKATDIASEATGMDISIKRISLSFPFNLVVHDAVISQETDTVLDVNKLTVKVQLKPLFKKEIELDGLELNDAYLNTRNLIEGMKIVGNLGDFFIDSHGVALNPETAIINNVRLKNTHLWMSIQDSTQSDTTSSSPLLWKIKLEKADLNNVSFALQMPDDSMDTHLNIGNASLRDGLVDLQNSAYSVNKFIIKSSAAEYNVGKSPAVEGFDPSHISFNNINVQLDSIYYCGNKIQAKIHKFDLKERSGLEIISSKGNLIANDDVIKIPGLEIKTPDSYISLSASADWSLSNINNDGSINARLMADIGKNDIFKFIPYLPEDFKINFPPVPVQIRAGIDGSLNSLKLTTLSLSIPGHIRFSSEGEVSNVLDSIGRNAHIGMKGEFEDLRFARAFLGDAVVPSGTVINGIAGMNSDSVYSDIEMLQADGKVSVSASLAPKTNEYNARLNVSNLDLHNFLPKDSLFTLSAYIDANGKGFDFMSDSTTMELNASVPHFRYGKRVYSGMKLTAGLKDGLAKAELGISDNLMDISTILEASLSKNSISASLNAAIRRFDLYAMGLTDNQLKIAQNINVDVKSDLKKRHSLKASVKNISLITPDKTFHTKDLNMGVAMAEDSLRSYINSGDLTFLFRTTSGIDRISANLDKISRIVERQWKERSIDQAEWRTLLPETNFRVLSGDDNPFANMLETRNIGFKKLYMSFNTSPEKGLNGSAYLYGLKTDSLQLDSISFKSVQDTAQIVLRGEVKANKTKYQEAFDITLDGEINKSDAQIMAKYTNEKKETGALIGLRAVLQEKGVSVHIIPDNPILVYRNFNVNKNNYIYLNEKGRIYADMSLYDDNRTGLNIYSTPDSTVMQDVSVAINRLNIGEFKRILPYMPDIEGEINAEGHYIVSADNMTMASVESRIDGLAYYKEPLGNWAMSAVYLPKENNEHHIDGFISRNDVNVAGINGSYISAQTVNEKDKISANLSLEHFPLYLANAFVSRDLAVVNGYVDGKMSLDGSADNPAINGNIGLDSVYIDVPMTSMNLRFENKTINITGNKLIFDKYKIYSKGKSPYVIDGNINFTNMSDMMMDLRMTARNFELFNGKKTKNSLVYGKMYIDLNTTIKGNPDRLAVKGNANILGSSNFTYILKDSPLTVEDRLNETVTFVNFSDTTTAGQRVIPQISLGGIDMLMNLHIDQAVQCKVDINESGSNYMQVEGGGDLAFQYTPDGNMYLNGRYSLMSGEMKYELPVIPLKTFQIKEGSYIEWTGNIMNPNLNIKAYERIRSSVAQEGQSSRMVSFDVGVNITNRLENLGFTFTVEAPEDGSMQNELAAMSPSQKNKIAVTMLVTGMYLSDNSSGNLDANSALNSFLQSEINNIAGSALKSIDLNVGMETTNETETGASRTDYNFQFAKRFWNNRVRVVIGGKISTGNNASRDESFIDNVSLEYRLDNSGTRYVKLFHDKKYANVLEGEVTETGAGIVLKKKVSKLGELFIFRRNKRERERNREDQNDDEKNNNNENDDENKNK